MTQPPIIFSFVYFKTTRVDIINRNCFLRSYFSQKQKKEKKEYFMKSILRARGGILDNDLWD